jgi:hypothetical protein
VCGFIEIEANSVEDAIDQFYADRDEMELPEYAEYVDGSFDLSASEPEVIALYNK